MNDISTRHDDITEAVKNNFPRFKTLMCQNDFISEHVRDNEDKTSNEVMHDFKQILRHKKENFALQDACTKFLSILQELGPPASDLVGPLRDRWNNTASGYELYKESAFIAVPRQEETDNCPMPSSSSDTDLLTLHQRQKQPRSNTAPTVTPLNSVLEYKGEESDHMRQEYTVVSQSETQQQCSQPPTNGIQPTATGIQSTVDPRTVQDSSAPADSALRIPQQSNSYPYLVHGKEGMSEIRQMIEQFIDEMKKQQEFNSESLRLAKATYEEQIRLLKSCNDEQVRSLKSSNDEHVRSLKSSNDEHVRSLKSSNDEHVRSLKSSNDEQVRSLKLTCGEQISAIKSANDDLRNQTSSINNGAGYMSQSLKSASNDLNQEIEKLRKEQTQMEERENRLHKQKIKTEKEISEFLRQERLRINDLEKEAKGKIAKLEREWDKNVALKLKALIQLEIKKHSSECNELAMEKIKGILADANKNVHKSSCNAVMIIIILIVILILLVINTAALISARKLL